MAGVKLFVVTDKVPPDKEELDKTLEDAGGEDAKEPNPEAKVVKKESLAEESLNEIDSHGSLTVCSVLCMLCQRVDTDRICSIIR